MLLQALKTPKHEKTPFSPLPIMSSAFVKKKLKKSINFAVKSLKN